MNLPVGLLLPSLHHAFYPPPSPCGLKYTKPTFPLIHHVMFFLCLLSLSLRPTSSSPHLWYTRNDKDIVQLNTNRTSWCLEWVKERHTLYHHFLMMLYELIKAPTPSRKQTNNSSFISSWLISMQIILDENVDSRGHLTAGSTTKKIKIKVFVNHSLRMSIDIFVVDKITAAGIVWTYSILTETDPSWTRWR